MSWLLNWDRLYYKGTYNMQFMFLYKWLSHSVQEHVRGSGVSIAHAWYNAHGFHGFHGRYDACYNSVKIVVSIKARKAQLDLNFLKNCQSLRVFPKFLLKKKLLYSFPNSSLKEIWKYCSRPSNGTCIFPTWYPSH